ncbi:DUF3168 domain-containing protein [Alkalihalobacillus sp. BA299]|uniref:tail completion protein gp17 n=1 Tax=Alkalihalobacillus sp. BA299 TaxID=2815938 RepID=UPI001AD9B6C5|nr:DUF3168 domain-containing protein [Alkalihalobacillus sp. BA299]
MTKMINIRKDIAAFLKSKHPDVNDKPRVWAEEAPSDAVYPYIVYDFTNSIDNGIMENFVLELDFWDNQTDTTALETLCGTVDEDLHRRTVMITSSLSATFYRENRRQIRDPDKRLRRRQYVYQVRVHGE